ncbi:Down syndrome cell adhesion molecule homolog isoform X2 [Dendroctonus ponderosae]|uniref:Fibronectin type-III domain-containing protein n=1 Tax=Dendroctonus ponderosae TaxID=77166 RepID=A0AAR5Q430_DENPD|nr:Down syndrome cell adhesion molecule homolog isoform X2 [Dendroctonus ponderosae]
MYHTLQFVLCLVSIFLQAKAATVKRVSVDLGKNVTIKCPLNNSRDVMWEREGREPGRNTKMTVLESGSMFLATVDRSDSGIYSCIRENDVKDIRGKVNVTVRTPPPPLVVSIKCSTILVLVLWQVIGTGGYPISYFGAQYRPAFINTSWIPISPNHIMPSSRQIEVYSLRPNTTYEFRMWATNQLGKSPVTYVLATTKAQYTEEELARHLLKGADQFDTRWWAAAVGIVMGALVLLGLGTCLLLCRECQRPSVEDEPEIIELLPNIILNPGFEGPSRFDDITPDENSNNGTLTRLNNNTVVQPQDL